MMTQDEKDLRRWFDTDPSHADRMWMALANNGYLSEHLRAELLKTALYLDERSKRLKKVTTSGKAPYKGAGKKTTTTPLNRAIKTKPVKTSR